MPKFVEGQPVVLVTKEAVTWGTVVGPCECGCSMLDVREQRGRVFRSRPEWLEDARSYVLRTKGTTH